MTYMLGILGTCQQGETIVTSTLPSIATSSSGNYDKAFLAMAKHGNNELLDVFNLDGSEFSSGSASPSESFNHDFLATQFNSGNSIRVAVGCYLREGSQTATGFTVTLHSLVHNIGNSNDYASTPSEIVGGPTTTGTQDLSAVGGNGTGIGTYVNVNAGGGRGGLTWGRSGDYLEFKLKGAVNSVDCDPSNITLRLNWNS